MYDCVSWKKKVSIVVICILVQVLLLFQTVTSFRVFTTSSYSRSFVVRSSSAESVNSVHLEKMLLPELRLLYRRLGGTPGQLRKSELVEECG